MTGNLGSLESLTGVSLQEAVARTGLGIVACDEHGRLTLISPMLQELFGRSYAPVEAEEFPEYFRLYREDGVTPLPPEEMPIALARTGEYVRDHVVTARDRDERIVHLQCNAAPRLDGGGRVVGAVVLAQDVTAAHEASMATAALRERLVQTVNHEFRTPLAALLGNLEVVRDHADAVPEDLARALAAIERAGWRMSDLVCTVAGLIEREGALHQAGRRADGAPLPP